MVARIEGRTLDSAAVGVAASLYTGFSFIAADAIRRAAGREWPVSRHLIASLALYVALAAIAGFVLALIVHGVERLADRWLAKRRRARVWAVGGLYGVAAGALVTRTALWTFTGTKAERFMPWGPVVMIAGIALSALLLTVLVKAALSRARTGRRTLPLLFAVVLTAIGGGFAYIDLTVYVALYARLHALLEMMAAACWLCAGLLICSVTLRPWPRRLRFASWFAGSALLWAVALTAIGPLRSAVEGSLRHVWLEPAYVGRSLSRFQTARAFIKNPAAWRGATLSRMDQVRARFDLATTAPHPMWEEPATDPPEVRKKIAALRGEPRDLNLLVFYVDTLRYDAATDPAVMPTASQFSTQSLHFTQAYAAGSDTMRSLPALTSGRYETKKDDAGDILHVAKRANMSRAVILARSAQQFLAKERPEFKFDESITIRDYAEDRKDVWGYGADWPTSGKMVDAALDYLRAHQKDRFMLWLFNFDQHNWRELESKWVHEMADRYRVPDEAPLNWRYRVVARAIDAEFARLLSGLKQLGLAENTIVLFVSDHGEALGRDGFWVHSIFLWESLVHVPLMLRIPGVEPKVVYDVVSLADVTPTLAPFLDPKSGGWGYHGVDLMRYLVTDRPERPRPILMNGASHDTLLRIGMIEPGTNWKLVLPLESGNPELYDIHESDPDWVSLADEQPARTLQMLSKLVRSPVFPRNEKDLEVKTAK